MAGCCFFPVYLIARLLEQHINTLLLEQHINTLLYKRTPAFFFFSAFPVFHRFLLLWRRTNGGLFKERVGLAFRLPL